MSGEKCVMCKKDIDDRNQYGEKITYEDITVHYFCLLLSSKAPQNGKDDEGILGFLVEDIKEEVKRAKKLQCVYCRRNGANIGCCNTQCRRSFHLPCAAERNCRFEFFDRYKSFCDRHHGIVPPIFCHQTTDVCVICLDEMGEYNVVQSIKLCCKNNWVHKNCAQTYAYTSGYMCKCPLCNETDKFRRIMVTNGVFIPDSDARWEIADENPFYGFREQNARPTECSAKHCIMEQGRNYHIDENAENLLIFCGYCGSKGVHADCLGKKKRFICDDCEPEPQPKRRKVTNIPIDEIPTQQNDINNNIPTTSNNVTMTKPTVSSSHIRPIDIVVVLPSDNYNINIRKPINKVRYIELPASMDHLEPFDLKFKIPNKNRRKFKQG